MTALLETLELSKDHPSGGRDLLGRPRALVRALDRVSLCLERGESLGLVGESGSGKSTLARLVVGLDRPSAGSVRFDGADLAGLSRAEDRLRRRRVQLVFQDPYASLDPRQTVRAILEEPLAIHRLGKPRARRLRALELLESVGLPARALFRHPHEFSGGQRQRIGIARALALEPELLVCDEPVSALDVSVRAQILNLFLELRERLGLSYLFISHDLAVVRVLCGRIAVLLHGRLVELAPAPELFADPRHPYTRALLAASPVADPALERARPRRGLGGEAPSALRLPSGCPFHPRCPARGEVPGGRCASEPPELRPLPREAPPGPAPRPGVSPARSVACHLGDPAGQGNGDGTR